MISKSAAVLLLGLGFQAPFVRGEAPVRNGTPFSGRYKDYNVILISLSNVAADHMSLYGYARKTTPELEQWAKDALVFDNAFTHASWTLPVGVSLFTSMYPFSHQVLRRSFSNALGYKIRTLPEILRERGYRTGACTGGLDYYPLFSHMRGFQYAARNPAFSKFSLTIPQAQGWLSRRSQEKFMLFLHGYDTHCPFVPSENFLGKLSPTEGKRITIDPTRCVRGFQNSKDFTAIYAGACPNFPFGGKGCQFNEGDTVHLTQDDIDYMEARYDETILETDASVVKFLRSLDPELLQKTLVVIFSDHGEMFAKHGRFGRVGTARGTHYDTVMHVPLIIKFPGGPAGRVGGLVQLIDIMPTLLDALGIAGAETMQGKSLDPLIEGGAEVNPYVYSGAVYKMPDVPDSVFNVPTQSESIRDRKWKLIHEFYRPDLALRDAQRKGKVPGLLQDTTTETYELYDIAEDPRELHDVSKSQPYVLEDLRGKLKAWSQWAVAVSTSPRTNKIPADIVRKAKERGYW